MMDDVQMLLREVMETDNEWTMCVPGTGMAGMEAAVVNLVEPGDEILVCVAGVFGERMVNVAERAGAVVSRVDAEWGTAVQPEQVREALKTCHPKAIGIVHAETSTGVLQPLSEIGKIAHDAGALFIVDCVTSLGGVSVGVDAVGADVAYSGTQKCLGAPPSLSPISFSSAAVSALQGRKSAVQSFYLDAAQIWRYWGPDRAYHQTGMVNMTYALREALLMVHEEGLAARFARHRQNQQALIAGAEAMGLDMAVRDPAIRLPSLTTIMIPEGISDQAIRSGLLSIYGIEIGSGMGKYAGKAWRVGLMGYASQRANVMLLLSALGDLLKNERVDEGLAAASATYAQA